MTSGALIRQARTRAGLSQVELSQRSGKDRAQIARWERDVVQPSLETLRELLRACGLDVELALVPYEPDSRSTTPACACARPDTTGAAAGRCSGARPLMARDHFDPYALLEALERQRVTYIIVGGLGRVLHGSDELTDGLDIVPSMREENLRRLELALDELNARRPDGRPLALERDLDPPAGARAGDGRGRAEDRPRAGRDARLRRPAPPRQTRADRPRPPPLGRLAGDHARMLAALDREQDHLPLQTCTA